LGLFKIKQNGFIGPILLTIYKDKPGI